MKGQVGSLLLVSVRDKQGSKIYVYDRRDLPKEIVRLYDLTGAPLDIPRLDGERRPIRSSNELAGK